MKDRPDCNLRPGLAFRLPRMTALGERIGKGAGKAAKGIGAGASAVAKRAKNAREYVADSLDVEFDLKTAWEGAEDGIKKAKAGKFSKVAGAVRGAVESGGINVTMREKSRANGKASASHGGRSHKPATRGPRSAKRGSSK